MLWFRRKWLAPSHNDCQSTGLAALATLIQRGYRATTARGGQPFNGGPEAA
jgi:hypothetical protein